MKQIAVFFTLLLSALVARAQFPVKASVIGGGNSAERRYIESSPLQGNQNGYDNTVAQTQNGNTASGSVAKNITLAGQKVPPTRTWFITDIVIFNNGTVAVPINLQIANGNQTPSAQTGKYRTVLVPGPGYVDLPINQYADENTGIFMVTGAAVSGNFTANMSVIADNLTNDKNYDANTTWLINGTSISSSTGPTYGSSFYHFMLRDYYNGLGSNIRVVVKGNGSWTIANTLDMCLSGNVKPVGKPSLIILEMGMNDAVGYSAGGTTTTGIQTSYTSYVNFMLKTYPGIPIVVCGSSPRQDSYEVSGLQPLRAWISSTLVPNSNSGLTKTTVFYCDLSANFDRTINSNYVDATGSNNGVHPSAAGHLIMYNDLLPVLNTISSSFIIK